MMRPLGAGGVLPGDDSAAMMGPIGYAAPVAYAYAPPEYAAMQPLQAMQVARPGAGLQPELMYGDPGMMMAGGGGGGGGMGTTARLYAAAAPSKPGSGTMAAAAAAAAAGAPHMGGPITTGDVSDVVGAADIMSGGGAAVPTGNWVQVMDADGRTFYMNHAQ